jgi:transcriptional regulator with XRE-family HTH domain
MFALIGETLRRLRRDKGLTLEDLGKSAELGRGQLSRIENSRQEATLSTLAKILSSQGVSRREFFRRYDMVESEALAVERQQAGAAPGEAGDEGSWPQEIQDVLNRVESFVDATLHQPRPVAQGAFEVGDLVVLFRVIPKNPESATARKPGEPAAAPPKAPASGTRRRPGAKRKR